jgi:hypothetical protein
VVGNEILPDGRRLEIQWWGFERIRIQPIRISGKGGLSFFNFYGIIYT